MPFFLTPLFAIAGIIGASIPVVIHLLNRERAQRLIFSTLRFIQMSHQTNVQRHHLKRMLLLLLRILILTLLGLAFARPFFAAAPDNVQQNGAKRNVLMILDTSYSMQYQQNFPTAKKEALKILANLDDTDAVGLILTSNKPSVVAPLGSELSHIRAALNTAVVTNETTDYLEALQTADEILEPVLIGQKSIYLIADMQRSGWNNFIETDKLSPDVDITFINVRAERTRNVAITGISVPPIILNEQKATQLVARIYNFGDEPVENMPVHLIIDGQVMSTTKLDIESNDINDAIFKIDSLFSSGNEATHTGWVEIPDDALTIDNQHYFMLKSLTSIKVLCVNGDYRTPVHQNETFFLKMAIEAGSEAVPIDLTETRTVPDAETLARYDVLILANVAEFTANDANVLKEYVSTGGGLMVAVGDKVQGDSYQGELSALMPCTFVQPFGDAFAREEFWLIATVNYEHPIFAPFKEPNHGDFGKARVYQYLEAVPVGNDTSIIATYDDGNPALFEKTYGTGRVLCFTSTLDREWTDLPIRAVYLPFLHESIKYLALKRDRRPFDYHVGDSIELRGFEDLDTQKLAIFNPDNEEMRLNLITEDNQGAPVVTYQNTGMPGIYSVHAPGAPPRYFVVNLDTVESNLAAREIEELKSMLMGNNDANATRATTLPAEELVSKYHGDVEKNQGVWVYLLLAVCALAVIEMFFANRI